jgi:hypothetical protein
MILFYILLPIITIVIMMLPSIVDGDISLPEFKLKKSKIVKTNDLSKTSNAILDRYNKLPERNRVYEDLPAVLHALDVKHENPDSHFVSYSNTFSVDKIAMDTNYPSLKCCKVGHCSSPCPYRDYIKIMDAIKEIEKANVEQEKALKIAGVQAGLDELENVTARLRQEATLIKSVTKELA